MWNMDRGASSRLGRPLDLGGHGGLDKVIGTVKLHSRVDSPEFKFKFKVKFKFLLRLLSW